MKTFSWTLSSTISSSLPRQVTGALCENRHKGLTIDDRVTELLELASGEQNDGEEHEDNGRFNRIKEGGEGGETIKGEGAGRDGMEDVDKEIVEETTGGDDVHAFRCNSHSERRGDCDICGGKSPGECIIGCGDVGEQVTASEVNDDGGLQLVKDAEQVEPRDERGEDESTKGENTVDIFSILRIVRGDEGGERTRGFGTGTGVVVTTVRDVAARSLSLSLEQREARRRARTSPNEDVGEEDVEGKEEGNKFDGGEDET